MTLPDYADYLARFNAHDILQIDPKENGKLKEAVDDYFDELYQKVSHFPPALVREYLISGYNHKDKSRYGSCSGHLGYIRSGDLVYADFGHDAYLNEVGYCHYAIVLQMFNAKALVIPMTSNSQDYRDAYDPKDNPNGKSHLMRLGRIEPLTKESTLFLNDLRYINTSRIIDIKAHIDEHSELFKSICDRARRTLLPIQEIATSNNDENAVNR